MSENMEFKVPSFPNVPFFIKEVRPTEVGLVFIFETVDPTDSRILSDPQFKTESMKIVDAIMKSAIEVYDTRNKDPDKEIK